jgi:hypothetical protein
MKHQNNKIHQLKLIRRIYVYQELARYSTLAIVAQGLHILKRKAP